MIGDLFSYFGSMLNFRNINWWTLISGIGLNFVITSLSALGGTYFSANPSTSEVYASIGAPVMVLVVFLACLGAGWLTAKIADDVPMKHAFLSSLGSLVPFVFVGALSLNLFLIMLALVAVAGNINGGMLAIPKSHTRRPPRD